ncbi:uridine kinase family protein [Monashia sp. NPDC004114]
MKRARIVGLTGPSAAGKSTLARQAMTVHGSAVVVQQDWYFRNSSECPIDANFCELRWMHVDDFIRDVTDLAHGTPINAPFIDFSTFERQGTVRIDPAPLVIVEGMTILRVPQVDIQFARRFYLDIEMAQIASRKRTRDIFERSKSREIVESQLRWIAEEYARDETLRSRLDVTVLHADEPTDELVTALLA